MRKTLKENLEKIFQDSEGEDDAVACRRLHSAIYEFENESIKNNESVTIDKLFEDRINALSNPEKYTKCIPTGLSTLDGVINGYTEGELIVIGGRPSMGKTAFMLSLLDKVSETTPVMLFSLELSKEQIIDRTIVSLSGVPFRKIKNANLNKANIEAIKNAVSIYNDRKIVVCDVSNPTMSAIKALCSQAIDEHGVRIVFIDYLQMLSSHRKYVNREAEIGYVVRELKNFAKQNNITIVLTSQLNRSVETRTGAKRPQLSDLRESGAIEQDADKVLLLYRPEYYGLICDEEGESTEGLAEVIVAKNRSGLTYAVKMEFIPEIFKFKERSFFNELEGLNGFDVETKEVDNIFEELNKLKSKKDENPF